jgi:hypothetical protein
MAGRRNATPLFDFVGPLADTGSKPRYRSAAPPPAPIPTPSILPPENESTDSNDAEHETVAAVAQPGREPIEVHTAESLSESDLVTAGRSAGETTANTDANEQSSRSTDQAESSAQTIETRHAPHGNPATAKPQPGEGPADELDDFEDFRDSFAFLGTLKSRTLLMVRRFAGLKETLLVGTNRLYFVSGIVIIGLVLVWLVLNAVLSSSTPINLDTSAELQTHADGGIVDPLTAGVLPLERSGAAQPEGRRVPTIEMGGRAGAVPPPRPPAGERADPRVPGQNYLHLASRMKWDEAVRAVAFLAEQGTPAIAVGMDTGTLEGNNTERFWLISLFDVPEGRFNAMLGQRRAHLERMQVLGGIWAKEHDGTVDFHDPYWRKYDP